MFLEVNKCKTVCCCEKLIHRNQKKGAKETNYSSSRQEEELNEEVIIFWVRIAFIYNLFVLTVVESMRRVLDRQAEQKPKSEEL